MVFHTWNLFWFNIPWNSLMVVSFIHEGEITSSWVVSHPIKIHDLDLDITFIYISIYIHPINGIKFFHQNWCYPWTKIALESINFFFHLVNQIYPSSIWIMIYACIGITFNRLKLHTVYKDWTHKKKHKIQAGNLSSKCNLKKNL